MIRDRLRRGPADSAAPPPGDRPLIVGRANTGGIEMLRLLNAACRAGTAAEKPISGQLRHRSRWRDGDSSGVDIHDDLEHFRRSRRAWRTLATGGRDRHITRA
jgi:hypothetical protein